LVEAATAGESVEGERLRVLVADEKLERLQQIVSIVESLGHEVVAQEVDLSLAAETSKRLQPDVAFVELGESAQHALDLITEITEGAACPVVALLESDEPAYIKEAAKRGVFASIVSADRSEVESAIDIVRHRFLEFHNLQGAFGRRAFIEQAKGILMERHDTDADRAYELLRKQSQRTGTRIIEVARAVVEYRQLLPGRSGQPGDRQAPG
jgi:AmiR/NasT family two-component response regulator